MEIRKTASLLENGTFSPLFQNLYGARAAVQPERYIKALAAFREAFPERTDVRLFSAPGRTEIGGNHTDHQNGRVLAGAVNLDALAVVSLHSDGCIRWFSEGFSPVTVDLADTRPQPGETGTAALLRGISAGFTERGVSIGGFDAYCVSDVISGSGLSSSAAFEVLVGTVMNECYNGGAFDPFTLAKIGWFAETVYFGKKCGLLDQTVSAFGGLVAIDFADTENPKVTSVNYHFPDSGHALCITDTKSSHEDLTEDYVSIREEMAAVAACFGETLLSRVDKDRFYEELANVRAKTSDRAVLRAAHFFDETERAKEEADALLREDFSAFLGLVNASGESSASLLQNLYSVKTPGQQAIPLALHLSRRVLGGAGAVRVHGGGFAGTIQAFVPLRLLDTYVAAMESVFGKGACHVLTVRPVGGTEILP